MTLRILNAKGVSVSGTLHVLNAKGTISNSAVGKLRILNAKGTASTTPSIGTLHVLNGKGAVALAAPGRLRVLSAIGAAAATGIAVAPFATRTVKSFELVQIAATAAPGTPIPTSYTYALVPNSDVHTLQINADGTFVAPGRLNGCTVNIAVTAHLGASNSAPQTAQFLVGRHNDFIRLNGTWTAVHIVNVLHK